MRISTFNMLTSRAGARPSGPTIQLKLRQLNLNSGPRLHFSFGNGWQMIVMADRFWLWRRYVHPSKPVSISFSADFLFRDTQLIGQYERIREPFFGASGFRKTSKIAMSSHTLPAP